MFRLVLGAGCLGEGKGKCWHSCVYTVFSTTSLMLMFSSTFIAFYLGKSFPNSEI